jgi:hypothetical protein
VTTTLPLGYTGHNNTELPVAAFAMDQFGAVATVNASVTVLAPSLEKAVAAVANQTSVIESLADSGDTGAALLLIQAASDLLNTVFEASSTGVQTRVPTLMLTHTSAHTCSCSRISTHTHMLAHAQGATTRLPRIELLKLKSCAQSTWGSP